MCLTAAPLRRQSELKTFQPWVGEVEERIKAGQKKPTSLAEAQEMLKSVQVSTSGRPES